LVGVCAALVLIFAPGTYVAVMGWLGSVGGLL